MRVVVAGAGAFGAWSALALRRRGAEVLLVDPWGAGNRRASSGGETRVLRAAYGAEHVYTEMVARSFGAWEQLERDASRPLFARSPVLWLFGGTDDYVRDALPALERAGLAAHPIALDEVSRRWPVLRLDPSVSAAWIEESAGVVAAREACRAIVERFVEEGGTFRETSSRPGVADGGSLRDVRLADGTRETADAFVFACGPWLPTLFPEVVGPLVRVTRQEIVFFGTPPGAAEWTLGRLPIWVELGREVFYGVPAHAGRGFKVGEDVHGPDFEPTSGDRRVSEEGVERARAFLRRRFPGLGDAPVVDTRVCQYSVTPDGHLLVDRLPLHRNVLVAGGGSGHGFKLSPAVGALVADVLLDGRVPPRAFRIDRDASADRAHPAFPES